jgi:hypothetical protein
MFRHRDERAEGESERQLRKWGFELRGGPHIAYGLWDHYEDGRTIALYDDGGWIVVAKGGEYGRGTASLMTYLRAAKE